MWLRGFRIDEASVCLDCRSEGSLDVVTQMYKCAGYRPTLCLGLGGRRGHSGLRAHGLSPGEGV